MVQWTINHSGDPTGSSRNVPYAVFKARLLTPVPLQLF
jgi:hypothetical protein